MTKKSACCCGGGSCCNSENKQDNDIVLDFLYLDLSTCDRCQNTDENIESALAEVSNVLKAAGKKITLNKINIVSKELAEKYEFCSSPTIRINGRDIDMSITENLCTDCSDICGDNVSCRTFVYEGNTYNQPPKEMIINALLKEVYAANHKITGKKSIYKIPDNLKNFFVNLEKKEG